jgi:GNAT superfamily N-acetyltransferase
MTAKLEIKQAESAELIELARELFREYSDSMSTDPCFQTVDAELAGLPGQYGPPEGRLYLAFRDEQPAGCCAFRKIGDSTCELKRMYVRPLYRGQGIGRLLAHAAVQNARAIGYERMCLDTLPSMRPALKLYRTLGFEPVEPYMPNPIQGGLCFELGLK